jgi:hypothetical protein
VKAVGRDQRAADRLRLGQLEKDAEVLKAVAEATQGRTSSSARRRGELQVDRRRGDGLRLQGRRADPIDVNMAKQLNILLTNLGVPSTTC